MQIYFIDAHGPRAQGDPLINSGNFSRWQCLSSSQNPPRMTPSGFPRQPMYITRMNESCIKEHQSIEIIQCELQRTNNKHSKIRRIKEIQFKKSLGTNG